MSDQMKHLQSDQVRQRTQRRPWWATEKHCLPANTDKFLSYGKHSTHGILSLQHKKKKKTLFLLFSGSRHESTFRGSETTVNHRRNGERAPSAFLKLLACFWLIVNTNRMLRWLHLIARNTRDTHKRMVTLEGHDQNRTEEILKKIFVFFSFAVFSERKTFASALAPS